MLRIYASDRDEWNAIHRAGLGELIRTNIIFDREIIEFLSTINKIKKAGGPGFEGTATGDAMFAVVTNEIAGWPKPDTVYEKFQHIFIPLSNFYDHLFEQLEATHSAAALRT